MCQPLAETDLIITGGPESLAPPAHGKENANPAALVVPTRTPGDGRPRLPYRGRGAGAAEAEGAKQHRCGACKGESSARGVERSSARSD